MDRTQRGIGGSAARNGGSGAAAGTVRVVPNLTALEALPGSVHGQLVFVESLQCQWEKNSEFFSTPDGITRVQVFGAAPGICWERLVGTTNRHWLSQATWYVDPWAGDDENSGQVGSPLFSLDEWNRRVSVGPLEQDTELILLTDMPGAGGATLRASGAYTLSLRGVPVSMGTGTIDTLTARVHAGASPEGTILKATAGFDFSTYIGTQIRIRITSGANTGAIAWILTTTTGNDTVRTSVFAKGDPLLGTVVAVNPSAGNTFVVEAVPYAGQVYVRLEPEANPTGATYGWQLVRDLYADSVNLGGSSPSVWGGGQVDGSFIQLDGVAADGMMGVSRSAFAWCESLGDISYYCCGWYDASQLVVNGAARLSVCAFQGADVRDSPLRGGPPKVVLADVQWFDNAYCLVFTHGATVICNGLTSGSGNGLGLSLNAFAPFSMTWDTAGNTPNIKATTAEIRIVASTNIDLAWATVNFRNNEQHGIATLSGGTRTVTARNANTQGVQISRATPGGTVGDLSAPTGSRAAGQFVINSASGTDTSTADWTIPGWASPDVTIGLAHALTPPV